MAEQNVLSAVGEQSERILHKATENIELCQRFMALVSLLALECNQRGANMNGGLQMGAVLMTGNRMVSKVSFSKLSLSLTTTVVPQNVSSLLDLMMQEARGLWLFVCKNPCLVEYLKQIVEKMDAYSRDKGKAFNEIDFENAFMDREDNVVLEIAP